MSLRPCSAWPRERVERHVPHLLSMRDFLAIDSIPTPDRGWVWVQLADVDAAAVAEALIARAASAGSSGGREAVANYSLAKFHASLLSGARKADHFRAVIRDAACSVAWAEAPSGGTGWDRAKMDEHSKQINLLKRWK